MHLVKAGSNGSDGSMAALWRIRVMRFEMTSDVGITRGMGDVKTVVIIAARVR
jgi:hypothetical protein